MTLTYISCSSDFYTFYVNAPLSLGCMIRKVSAEDIAIRGNGTGLEYMCPTRHFVYIFFNPVFQVSTAKNEINLFNNHVLIVAPVTFAPAGAMTPSAEFLLLDFSYQKVRFAQVLAFSKVAKIEGEVFVALKASQGDRTLKGDYFVPVAL